MSLDKFKSLHQQGNPLLLANVWDAHSAKLAEEAGCQAVGTSSHAISNSLGLDDGNNLSMEELLFFVKKIVPAVNIPVSVDIESGYATDAKSVAHNIKTLVNHGVVGINIEDSKMINGIRTLREVEEFTQMLTDIITNLKENNIQVFINLRTDTYVTKHPNALEETIARGKKYKEAGVDGFFVPLISDANEIERVINEVGLPLNVFAKKDGPDYEVFKNAGVHRISSGDAAYAKSVKVVKEIFTYFNNKNLDSLF